MKSMEHILKIARVLVNKDDRDDHISFDYALKEVTPQSKYLENPERASDRLTIVAVISSFLNSKPSLCSFACVQVLIMNGKRPTFKKFEDDLAFLEYLIEQDANIWKYLAMGGHEDLIALATDNNIKVPLYVYKVLAEYGYTEIIRQKIADKSLTSQQITYKDSNTIFHIVASSGNFKGLIDLLDFFDHKATKDKNGHCVWRYLILSQGMPGILYALQTESIQLTAAEFCAILDPFITIGILNNIRGVQTVYACLQNMEPNLTLTQANITLMLDKFLMIHKLTIIEKALLANNTAAGIPPADCELRSRRPLLTA